MWARSFNRGDEGFDDLIGSLQNGTFNIDDYGGEEGEDPPGKGSKNASIAPAIPLIQDLLGSLIAGGSAGSASIFTVGNSPDWVGMFKDVSNSTTTFLVAAIAKLYG
ncbi:MAG: hypothetical protein MUE71_09435, partial [Chitinophagaceae bacterium]|nr:hypothetical protein [Chitinophagaceae bacterium]